MGVQDGTVRKAFSLPPSPACGPSAWLDNPSVPCGLLEAHAAGLRSQTHASLFSFGCHFIPAPKVIM